MKDHLEERRKRKSVITHHAAKKRKTENRLYFIARLGGKCIRCGWKEHSWGLDFDHIDPKEKELEIGKLLYQKDRKKIWPEMKKCQLLCSNCHRLKGVAFGDLGKGGEGNEEALALFERRETDW